MSRVWWTLVGVALALFVIVTLWSVHNADKVQVRCKPQYAECAP